MEEERLSWWPDFLHQSDASVTAARRRIRYRRRSRRSAGPGASMLEPTGTRP